MASTATARRSSRALPATSVAARAAVLGVGVNWALAYGLLGSNFSAVNDVALRGRTGALGFELAGFATTPHYEVVAPGAITLNLVAGQALGCFWFGETKRSAAGGCAGLAVGSLSGHARRYDTDGHAAALWTAVLASLNARLALGGPWDCAVAVSALAPLRSQAFVVAPLGLGFHSAPAALALPIRPRTSFLMMA